MARFDECVQAAKELRKSQWEIADALLEEIGPYDGSRVGRAKLKEVAAELLENGFEYDASRLGRLQRAAYDFPKGKRIEILTPDHHLAAGTFGFLQSVVAAWPNIRKKNDENGIRTERLTPEWIARLRKMREDDAGG